jgi:hypothetical protein
MSKRQAASDSDDKVLFGRFQKYVSNGHRTEDMLQKLTERTFRRFYQGTHGAEEERFEQVARQLAIGVPAGYRNLVVKPGFRKAILEVMADGQWRTAAQVLSALKESIPAADASAIQGALRRLAARPPFGRELRSKKIGNKSQYRLCDAAHSARQIPARLAADLAEGVKPIIEELKHWARQNQYEIPPSAMGVLAVRLEKMLAPLRESLNP